jgi:molecular chaperone GrpE
MERIMKMSKKSKEEKKQTQSEGLDSEVVEEVKPLSEIEVAHESIASLEKQLAESKNDYLKAYADTQNTRKRLNIDFENRSKFVIKGFALEILNVIDNFERAKANPSEDVVSLQKGMDMIYNQLLDVLSKEGVKTIEAENTEFDPNLHHAIVMEESEEVKPNTVIEVFQKGYMIQDKLLRPSVVKVSERKSEKE